MSRRAAGTASLRFSDADAEHHQNAERHAAGSGQSLQSELSAPAVRRGEDERDADHEPQAHHPHDGSDAEDKNIREALSQRMDPRQDHQGQCRPSRQAMRHADQHGPDRQAEPMPVVVCRILGVTVEVHVPSPVVVMRVEMPALFVERPAQARSRRRGRLRSRPVPARRPSCPPPTTSPTPRRATGPAAW